MKSSNKPTKSIRIRNGSSLISTQKGRVANGSSSYQNAVRSNIFQRQQSTTYKETPKNASEALRSTTKKPTLKPLQKGSPPKAPLYPSRPPLSLSKKSSVVQPSQPAGQQSSKESSQPQQPAQSQTIKLLQPNQVNQSQKSQNQPTPGQEISPIYPQKDVSVEMRELAQKRQLLQERNLDLSQQIAHHKSKSLQIEAEIKKKFETNLVLKSALDAEKKKNQEIQKKIDGNVNKLQRLVSSIRSLDSQIIAEIASVEHINLNERTERIQRNYSNLRETVAK